MSAAKKTTDQKWELTGAWAGAWRILAGVGVVGLAGAGFGYTQDARRFAFSWLFALMTFLAIALGAIFFVLIQRLTSAGWSVTVRRTAEFFAYGVIVLFVLALPILGLTSHLFPWMGHHGADHGAGGGHEKVGALTLIAPAHAQEAAKGHDDHAAAPAAAGHGAAGHGAVAPAAAGHGAAAPAAAGHGAAAGGHGGGHHRAAGMPDPHAIIHGELLERKSWWLSTNFFYARFFIYFAVWAFIALKLFGWSTEQDKSKKPELTLSAQGFAPAATFFFALSLTGGAVDWMMSLEPTWFSTIFGVYYFATAVVSSLATIILVTMALKDSGPLKGAVTVEHYHDLGKLLFGFNVFWAYIGFSQFMLIWYAALPEETTWYHNRWDYAPWSTVSLAILLGHFVGPFLWLISRNFKRNLGRLQLGAAVLLVMHVVDIYWFVMPNFHLGKEGFAFHWIDLMCLLAVGGIYGAFVFNRMTQHSLVPVGDPRLERSLHFQNA